jgi:tetratricopeptide (TPR) repeat protein
MQFEIADDVAGTFAHEFYGAVADGYPIDAALTEARKAIFAGGKDVEWGTPVLYLRAPDGRIFDVARLPAPPRSVEGQTRVEIGPTQRAVALTRNASVALANGKYADALTYLQEAEALDSRAPNLRELLDSAQQQRAVAETRAQRRRMFRDHLSAAGDLFAKADLAGAAGRIRDALQLNPDDPEALAMLARIREAARPPATARTSGHHVEPAVEPLRSVERQAMIGGAFPPDARTRPGGITGPGTKGSSPDDRLRRPVEWRAPLDDERDLLD